MNEARTGSHDAKSAFATMNELPTEFESASVFQRVLAQCIDTTLILVGIWLPVSIASWSSTVAMLACMFAAFIAFTYRILGDGVFDGAGLGKRLVGIYVVDASTRKPCSLWQAAIRMSVLVIPFVYIIEPIVLACDGQQRWGDQLAKTYVLRRKPKLAPEVSRPLRPINFNQLRDTLEIKRPDQ